jgi:hypothetical protein
LYDIAAHHFGKSPNRAKAYRLIVSGASGLLYFQPFVVGGNAAQTAIFPTPTA